MYVEVVSARLCKISGALQCVEIPIRLDLQEAVCFWEIPQSTPIKAVQARHSPSLSLLSASSSTHSLLRRISGLFCLSAEKWPWHRKLVLFCWLLLWPSTFSSFRVSAKNNKKNFSNGWSVVVEAGCCCVSSFVLRDCWMLRVVWRSHLADGKLFWNFSPQLTKLANAACVRKHSSTSPATFRISNSTNRDLVATNQSWCEFNGSFEHHLQICARLLCRLWYWFLALLFFL